MVRRCLPWLQNPDASELLKADMKIRHYVKRHWPAVIVAFAVGLYSILPQILFLHNLGLDFKNIYGVWNGDWLYYVARIRDVSEGYFNAANAYLWEHKNDLNPQVTGGELLIALFCFIFGLSIPTMQVVMDFAAPGLIGFLAYFLFYVLSRNRFLSCAMPLVLFTLIFNGLTKPINPQISFPLLLIFLIIWLQLLSRCQAWKAGQAFPFSLVVGGGVCLGLTFLVYFFSWSFLLVVIGGFLLLRIIDRDRLLIRTHLYLLFIAFLVAMPYFILQIKSLAVPFHQEMLVRLGFYHSHWPETLPRSAIAVLAVFLFVYFMRRRRLIRDLKAQAVLSLLAANVIFPNHQIISGFIIQNAVHWSFMPVFIYALTFAYVYFNLRQSRPDFPKILRYGFGLTFILLFIVPSYRLMSYHDYSLFDQGSKKYLAAWQKYDQAFRYLAEQTPKDSVVFANETLSYLIPAYTHNNVFYVWATFFLPGSDREIMERYLLSHIFIPEFYTEPNLGISDNKLVLWTQPAMTEQNTQLLPRLLGWPIQDEYSAEREIMFAKDVLHDLRLTCCRLDALRRYRVDYIVWDRAADPEWKVDEYSHLLKVYADDSIQIFRLSP